MGLKFLATVYIRTLQSDKSTKPLTVGTSNGKLITEKIIGNSAIGTPSAALKDQLWDLNILEGGNDGKRNPIGKFIILHYNTNDYIASTGKSQESLYLVTMTPEEIKHYDFKQDPKKIVWNFQVLPNWLEDSVGAPRPLKLAVQTAPSLVMDLKGANFEENTPIIGFEWKNDYWDKNKVKNQVWYLEAPRTLIKAAQVKRTDAEIAANSPIKCKPFTITAKQGLSANQTISVWDRLLGGQLLNTIKSGESQSFSSDVYLSMTNPDYGTTAECTNGRTTYDLNSFSIQFYYGDPLEGDDAVIQQE